ncbi:MAG: DNA polymerase I [Candidatus Dojkabacteria bacterium]
MGKAETPTILLVDSHALVHRAYHAFPQTLTTQKGELVNAVYGFTSLLLSVLKQFDPKYLITVFDSPGPTFRHELFKDYKGTRPKTDDALINQIDRVHEVVDALNIPNMNKQGFEADDLIGTLTKSKQLRGIKKIIVTGDRDLLQLVNGETSVFLAGTSISKSVMYDKTETIERLGFEPELLIDYKALRGDSSDNIPGVRGVGDKTATALIQQYHDLDNIYKHLDELKPAVKNKLTEHKDIAYLSRDLATIKTDVELPFGIDEAQVSDYNYNKAKGLFQELEFRSLMGRLPVPEVQNDELDTAFDAQISLIDSDTLKQAKRIDKTDLKPLWEFLDKYDRLAIRVARDSENIFDPATELAVANSNDVLAVNLSGIAKKDSEKLHKILITKEIVAFDGKYDLHRLYSLWPGSGDSAREKIHFDVLLAAYVALYGSGKFDLETLTFNQLGSVMDEQAESDGNLLRETVAVWKLYERFLDLLDDLSKDSKSKWTLSELYTKVELVILPILVKMERNGIKLDTGELNDLKVELEKQIRSIEQQVFNHVGHEFNIASPKQLGEVLFGELGMPGGKKTKSGGYSTNERELSKLLPSFPIVQKIMNWRELSKLSSTYTDALVSQVNTDTGRVHSSFNQAVAATGRLSSANPNMQNIPAGTEMGNKIREAFVAEDGHIFVSFDYSQQELRLLAQFSNEERLKEAFKKNIDIHKLTAAQLYKRDVEKVTKFERRVGKTVNFGVVYGISAFGLSEGLGIDRTKAQGFIDSFYASYPKVRTYYDRLLEQAKTQGWIETLLGRRKNTSGLDSSNWQLRAALEREIINFPLQGSAADMMKLAMISADRITAERYDDIATMILQIHDELVFEVKAKSVDEKRVKDFITDINKAMLEVINLDVPMKVNVEVGSNLGNLEEF